MNLPLAVVFCIEQVRKLSLDLLIVRVPRAGPRGAFTPLPFHGVADVSPILPDTEPGIDPSQVLAAIRTASKERDGLPDQRRAASDLSRSARNSDVGRHCGQRLEKARLRPIS